MSLLPTALYAPAARKEAEEAVSEEQSPVKEVGAEFKKLIAEAKGGRVPQLPGLSFEAAVPARLSERARSRAAASWQVTGNWVLLLIAGIAMAVPIIELLEVGREVDVSGIAWGLVVIWIVCQLMRLVMIMGYGEVKFGLNPSTQPAPDGGEEKDGGEEEDGGEKEDGGEEDKGQVETVRRPRKRGGGRVPADRATLRAETRGS